jgi:hypothetical protein
MTKTQVLLHIYKAYRDRADKPIKGTVDDILNTKLKDVKLPGTFKTELLQAGWKASKVDREQTLEQFGKGLKRAAKGYKTNLSPLYKWSAVKDNSIILQLIQAKKHSDKGEYTQKKEIIRLLLSNHPSQFHIDSRQTHTVGLTHKPSGFKIHTLKSGLPDEFTMLKTAFMSLQRP